MSSNQNTQQFHLMKSFEIQELVMDNMVKTICGLNKDIADMKKMLLMINEQLGLASTSVLGNNETKLDPSNDPFINT